MLKGGWANGEGGQVRFVAVRFTVHLEGWAPGGATDNDLHRVCLAVGPACRSIVSGSERAALLLRLRDKQRARAYRARDRVRGPGRRLARLTRLDWGWEAIEKHAASLEAERRYMAEHGHSYWTATLRFNAANADEAMASAKEMLRGAVALLQDAEWPVFELEATRGVWLVFRTGPAVNDPACRPRGGLGGSAGVREPRTGRPPSGSGAAHLPMPEAPD